MIRYLKQNFEYFAIILIGLMSFYGAIIYRIYSLNNIGIIISLILTLISYIIILYLNYVYKKKSLYSSVKCTEKSNIKKNKIKKPLWLLIAYLFFIISCLFILFNSQTNESIISPWQVVPNYFFIFFALTTACLILIIYLNTLKIKWEILLISLFYFLFFSVALIIYKIGYGFDPFIHNATIDLINKAGAVDPKPFYYLGEYSLIILLHKITWIPIIWLNKLLVPILASVSLPIAFYEFTEKWFEYKKNRLLIIIALLIIPFSFLIVTTPQNLAYIFLIITILYGLKCSNILELSIIYLFALTSLASHPIAGIPALLFSLAITIYHSNWKKIKKYLYTIIFTLTATVLPLAFYFLENTQKKAINYFPELPKIKEIISWPKLIIVGQENFILNFIYLYGFNIKIILSIISIIGIFIALKHRKQCKIFFICLAMSASLLISYFITKQIPFNFLIKYERDNYSDRIIITAIIFLIPFIITTFYGLIDKILKQKEKIIKIIFAVFAIILLASSLYISYPRFDRYYNSRGFSTSKDDIDAVSWIDNQTEKKYIALANQQVSAAALLKFGFNRYLKNNNNEIYFYPIPTSGQLYQYYLDMIYKKPAYSTMEKAMKFTGVKESYFILNKYWWASPKIIEEAKLEANSWQELSEGNIYIFKYILKE